MSKELYDILNELKVQIKHGEGIKLTWKQLTLLVKYIQDLEDELTGKK